MWKKRVLLSYAGGFDEEAFCCPYLLAVLKQTLPTKTQFKSLATASKPRAEKLCVCRIRKQTQEILH